MVLFFLSLSLSFFCLHQAIMRLRLRYVALLCLGGYDANLGVFRCSNGIALDLGPVDTRI